MRGTHRNLAIEYTEVKSLRLNPQNPRLHSDKQVNQLASSIRSFGFNVPVLVDAQSQVIAGHGRVRACQHLGIKEVPIIRLEYLSEHQVRAFTIADNRLTENAEWDDQLLGEQLKILSEAELDFSLEATGFEIGEIDLFIENLAPVPEGDQDPADAISELSAVQVSRRGDLWNLGKHQVLCGDALARGDYQLLMRDSRANLVFSDPPYNVAIPGHASGNGKVRHKDFLMASGEMTVAEFTNFLTDVLTLVASYSMQPSLHFICMDWRHVCELLSAGDVAYAELKNVCVWIKDNAGMGSLYRSQHEFIFVFKCGTGSHQNNIQLGRFGRSRTNVWHYPGVNSFVRSTEEGNLLELHPSQACLLSRRRDYGLLGTRRYRPRSLSGEWNDADSSRTDWPCLPRNGTGPRVRRHHHPPVAEVHGKGSCRAGRESIRATRAGG